MKIWIATPSITDSGLAFSVLSDDFQNHHTVYQVS
jgi:hypothetical protein